MYSIEQIETTLNDFRRMPIETEWLEFKEAKTNFDSDDLGKYFSALSNEANLKRRTSAWLIFGVSNKLPRTIVGTGYRSDKINLESLKHEVANQTNGITFQDIHELELPAGRVLMFQIPAAPAGIPTSWKGHFYGRDGESLAALSLQELETIRGQVTEKDWSAEVCLEATANDLDTEALEKARAKFQSKHARSRFGDEISGWDINALLERAKLMRNGKITRAAILLLGKPEAAHHVSPHPAQISWRLDAEEQAYELFGPPFFLTVEAVFRRLRNISFRIQPLNQLVPVELTKYDSKIILEALNNCIAHQDYNQNSRIILTEQVDRLVLQNIGGFYDGTVEDYVLRNRTPERYRNSFLAQAMVNLDMIDTMGMGIRRMFWEQRRRFFPLPEYDLTDTNHVRMTIYGKIIDENYTRLLMERTDLDLWQVMLLDKIQKSAHISREDHRKLKKTGLVEGRYPKLFVAARIAQATDKRADYTKHRAFDKQKCQNLILQFLDEHGEAKPTDVQRLLMSVLSDLLTESQKKVKIANLLQEMSREGSVRNTGARGRQARWVRLD